MKRFKSIPNNNNIQIKSDLANLGEIGGQSHHLFCFCLSDSGVMGVA